MFSAGNVFRIPNRKEACAWLPSGPARPLCFGTSWLGLGSLWRRRTPHTSSPGWKQSSSVQNRRQAGGAFRDP